MEPVAMARILFGLVAVLGMIGLLALAARKARLAVGAGGLSSNRRLGVVETMALDPRRRLSIVRCGAREYLIITGPAGETVVDTDLPPAEMTEAKGLTGAPARTFDEAMRKLQSFAGDRAARNAQAGIQKDARSPRREDGRGDPDAAAA